LDEQIEVEGGLTQAEREVAILDAASLKLEITSFKKEVSVLKKQKTDRIPQPRWKSLESRGRQGCAVSLFGKDWKEF
jgi:hypothetical protein